MPNKKVWMLHDIRDEYKPRYSKRYAMPYFLNTDRFLQGIDLIKANGTLALLDKNNLDYLDSDSAEQILTFDDGLKDHLEVGRMLALNGIAGVFFVPSGIFTGEFVDSHKIQFINSILDSSIILGIIKQEMSLDSHDWEELFADLSKSLWQDNMWSKEMVFITRFFRSYQDIELRRYVLDKIFREYVVSADKDLHKDFYLTEEDIKELIDLGHQIGGHGVFSYNLEFETNETIQSELLGSKEFLNSLNMPAQYALANGGFNANVIEAAHRIGFKKCYITSEESEKKFNNILHGRRDFTKEY